MKDKQKPLEIIQDFYAERDQEQSVDENMKFTITFPAQDLAFFDAVAESFGATRTRLIAGILEESIMPVLLSLGDSDKLSVLDLANEKAKLNLDEIRKKDKYYQRHGETKWAAWKEHLTGTLEIKNAKS